MNLKETTRAIAALLDNDLLAIRLHDIALKIAAVLVYIFVAGQMTGEYLNPIIKSISKAFVYDNNPIQAVNGLAQPTVSSRSSRDS